MNILLDTHIAVWAITDDPRLSAVSTLEVNNKRKSRSNNLEFTTAEFIESCDAAGYIPLPLQSRHFLAENTLRWSGEGAEHKDPYDRLLLAQAKAENYHLMTHDRMIPLFQEKCVIAV